MVVHFFVASIVKKVEELKEPMQHAETGHPYAGAKEHYILDKDDANFAKFIISILEHITPIPHKKPKKK